MPEVIAPRSPQVSVIVPVYNVERHVRACLSSIAGQLFEDFEAIVIDDGSTDGSLAEARACVAGDPRFRFLSQANRGLSAARNAGLDIARGDYLAFVDGDDRVAPGYLSHLHAALHGTGHDWSSCAIRFEHPDGRVYDHSGIHGQTGLRPDARPVVHEFHDWRRIVRHFPSAWNKLYRRSLIEGLRFDEGVLYEDHAFFQRAAARTDHLVRVPLPLYVQTRDRPGQITGEDSERVFQQFGILETCREIIMGSGKAGRREGFSMLVTRLLFERSEPLRNVERRARYAQACRVFLRRHGLVYDPSWDHGIGRAWRVVVAGRTPLSVVVAGKGSEEDWRLTLQALGDQSMRDAELLVPETAAERARRTGLRVVSCPPSERLGEALDVALTKAMGDYVVFLRPGDAPFRDGLSDGVETMMRSGADFGFCGFEDRSAGRTRRMRSGFSGEAPRGWTPTFPTLSEAVSVEAPIAATISRRGFLLEQGMRFRDRPLDEWLRAVEAMLRAMPAVRLKRPCASVAGAAPLTVDLAQERAIETLGTAIEAVVSAAASPRLEAGVRREIWRRALLQSLAAGGARHCPSLG